MSWTNPLILSFVGVSAVCEVLIIYGFAKLAQLRKHPGQYILLQSISQLYIDIHWLSIFNPVQKLLDDTSCRVLGALNYYAYILAWDYTIFLSLEIYLKVASSLSSHYKKRNKWYHIGAQINGLICFLIISTSDTTGRSGLGTCSIQANTVYEVFWVIIICGHMPICVGLVLLSFIHSRKSDFKLKSGLKYHMYVVIGFVLTISPPMVFDATNWGGLEFHSSAEENWAVIVRFKQICLMVGSLSGLVVFIARFSQKDLLKALWNSIKNKEMSVLTNISDTGIKLLPYSDLFEHLDKNMHAASVLSCLCFIFGSISEKFSTISTEDKSWEFKIKTTSEKATIIQYNFNYFMKVIKSENFDKESLLVSFDIEENLSHFNERSNFVEEKNFTFLTFDKRFFIKSLTESQVRFLCNMTKTYIQRQVDSGSYLASIYGLFSIVSKEKFLLHFMVFENLGYELKTPNKSVLVGECDLEDPLVSNFWTNRNSILGPDLEYVKLNKIQLKKLQQAVILDTKVLAEFKTIQYYLKIVYDENVTYVKNKKKLISFENYIGYIGIYFAVGQSEDFSINAEVYRKKFLKQFEDTFILDT